ncbi:MAG: hypothetical protein ABL977_03110 [Candidatus Eisenbacteria bacterium]
MLVALRYLHVLLAFAWFAAVFAAHWNTMQARKATDWSVRNTLFALNRGLSTMIALPALIGVGLVGNFFGMQLGYTMKATPLFMAANGLWAALVLVTLVMEMPATGALGALAHAAADAAKRGGEGEPAGWQRELGRWRLANGVQLLLYIVLLALMVAPWGPGR